MEAKTFADYVADEKSRILELKREYEQQIRDIEEQIADLDRHMVAVVQYERTVSGSRNVSENRRSQILKLVKAKPGIRRKAICEEMGIDVKSNKAQSVSVALTKLVQDGEIRRDGSRAYYPTR
ncbi:MAG: hypothetical protein F4077_03220 [Gammaproteobacteria bacterium]|nr:hypothetical protein [Gammaproteobacteria bacterium]MYI76763.1 hypothetical protein [Gammaproteobacteria bacterium]